MTTDRHRIFMKAYADCHEPFARYCSALAYGKMDAEDLMQDVLLSAFKHWEKIEKKGQLLHYLIRSAKNRSVSIWRKRRKEAQWQEVHHDRLRDKGVSADMLVDVGLVYEAMGRLPSKQRDALMLFEVSGFSMREIAEMLDSTEGAIKVLVSRGRAKLREEMAEEAVGSSGQRINSVFYTISLL